MQIGSGQGSGQQIQNYYGEMLINVIKFRTVVACQKSLDKHGSHPDQMSSVCHSNTLRFLISSLNLSIERDKRVKMTLF